MLTFYYYLLLLFLVLFYAILLLCKAQNWRKTLTCAWNRDQIHDINLSCTLNYFWEGDVSLDSEICYFIHEKSNAI